MINTEKFQLNTDDFQLFPCKINCPNLYLQDRIELSKKISGRPIFCDSENKIITAFNANNLVRKSDFLIGLIVNAFFHDKTEEIVALCAFDQRSHLCHKFDQNHIYLTLENSIFIAKIKPVSPRV